MTCLAEIAHEHAQKGLNIRVSAKHVVSHTLKEEKQW